MKKNTVIGLAVGLVVALCTTIGGFLGFLFALVFGGLGAIIGAQLDGDFDISTFTDSVKNRGRG